MKALDRLLQRWRLRKVHPYIGAGARVLDVGCAGGALRDAYPEIGTYVGIDPGLECSRRAGNMVLIRGRFPTDLGQEDPFDLITMLAVLEHVPVEEQPALAAACARLLKPGGRLVLTVPSPLVDHILTVLCFLRLADGIAIEQHHGYDARRTPNVFSAAGLTLVRWKWFQLGLNNLFVFEKV
ncbi:MAG: methyltransferase domain-containing protein [Planctomycetota bacterium]|nr:methyltransferase domain-containing protein [Planctomycetota bacterium]